MPSENIEYRLSYLQALLNPVGGVLQLALIVLSWIGGFFSMREAVNNSGFGFLSAGLYTASCILLFYRSRKRRSRRTITFRHDGVSFDLADCVFRGESETEQPPGFMPYRLLSVHHGLGGVAVLKAVSGHFVLVPDSAITRKELTRLIEERKAQGKHRGKHRDVLGK